MAVQSFAPIVDYLSLTAGAAATEVGSGEFFRVYGIVASAAAASIVTVATAAGATKFVFNIAANTSVVMNVSFIADAGLEVSCATNDANVTVLRAHSGT